MGRLCVKEARRQQRHGASRLHGIVSKDVDVCWQAGLYNLDWFVRIPTANGFVALQDTEKTRAEHTMHVMWTQNNRISPLMGSGASESFRQCCTVVR